MRFLVNEDGPTAVEDAVKLALILVACISIVTTLSKSISGTFTSVNSSLGTGGIQLENQERAAGRPRCDTLFSS